MKLYLVRHGEAAPAQEDPKKSLSEKGRQEVEKLATFLTGKETVRAKKVFHSGKARAKQTAEILAGAMAPGAAVEKIDGIEPNDPVMPLIEKIISWQEDSLIVGHLPYMGKLASCLVTGDENSDVAAFRTATIVCLEKIEERWLIAWMVCPETLL